MDFKEYVSDDSKYCLIDSQGFDYSKPITDFTKILISKIKEYNQRPYSFIDMIYYCTNNMNRFQIQEYKLINELKNLFNIERIPLFIIFTQCYFEEDFIEMKNFIQEKYNEEKFTCLRVISRKKENIPSYGLEELKTQTDIRLNNFKENAYASKFIANVSQILYRDYSSSFFHSFIKGIIKQDKNESIQNLFIKIFNMYRFEMQDLSNIYVEDIENIKIKILQDYEKNLKILTYKIIDLHAESCIIEEFKFNCMEELSAENNLKKVRLIKSLKDNEFQSFKEDIDSIVFPCCLDILKIEIIKNFNIHIFNSLQPKIEELMAKD